MPRSAQKSYARPSSSSEPTRDGLMLTMRGSHSSARMSSTEWIGASQVMRSRTGSSTGLVSSLMSGSSSQASGKASISFRYSSGSVSTSTGVPLYWPFRSSESTAPDAASSSISASLQVLVGSSLKRVPGYRSSTRSMRSDVSGSSLSNEP